MQKELSIIVPVYNEADNIEVMLNDLQQKIKRTTFELIIVYDFDQDNTIPVINSIKHSYSFEIKVFKNIYGHGVLNALKTGFTLYSADTLVVMMADRSDDASVVDRMYDLVKEGYALVCGSRYMKGGKHTGGGLIKGLLSRFAGLSLYYLSKVPVHDITNNFKMYTRVLLDKIKIESNGGFEIGTELTIKTYLMGFKIAEVPDIWIERRKKGQSRFKMFKWMPGYIKWYFYALSRRIK